MLKTIQDKKTQELAQAREKPQDGKTLDQIFLLLISHIQQREKYKWQRCNPGKATIVDKFWPN